MKRYAITRNLGENFGSKTIEELSGAGKVEAVQEKYEEIVANQMDDKYKKEKMKTKSS